MRARKLTDEQLERIRTVIAARKALPTHAELARLHGVSKSLVDQIAAGVMYKVPRGTPVTKLDDVLMEQTTSTPQTQL
jgi:predicted transcriptional regulator